MIGSMFQSTGVQSSRSDLSSETTHFVVSETAVSPVSPAAAVHPTKHTQTANHNAYHLQTGTWPRPISLWFYSSLITSSFDFVLDLKLPSGQSHLTSKQSRSHSKSLLESTDSCRHCTSSSWAQQTVQTTPCLVLTVAMVMGERHGDW